MTVARARRWARNTTIAFAMWTVPALLASVQIYLQFRERQIDAAWLSLFANQLAIWYPWVPFTPLLWWLARRFPLDRMHWKRSLLCLVPASLAVWIGYTMIFTVIAIPLEGRALTPSTYVSGLLGGLVARLTTNVLLVWAILGVAYAVEYHRRWRDRELLTTRLESQLTQAQLGALRTQLHPHFLFNALHTVGALVRAGDRDGAVRMLASLSELLRYSLERIDRQEVPLHDELEGVERYLDVAEVRFQDRLHVERQIDPESVDALVPTLLLQPLIENALRHGVSTTPDAGTIRLATARHDDRLHITLSDDGPGPSADTTLPETGGVGLRTTRARLRALYGTDHRFRLERTEPRGALVTIDIPFRVAGDRT